MPTMASIAISIPASVSWQLAGWRPQHPLAQRNHGRPFALQCSLSHLGRLFVEPCTVLYPSQLTVGAGRRMPDASGQQPDRLGALEQGDVADVVEQRRVPRAVREDQELHRMNFE